MKQPIDDESTDSTQITQKPIPKPVKSGVSLVLVILLVIAGILMIPMFLFIVLGLGLSGNSSIVTDPALMSMYIPFFIAIAVWIWMLLRK